MSRVPASGRGNVPPGESVRQDQPALLRDLGACDSDGIQGNEAGLSEAEKRIAYFTTASVFVSVCPRASTVTRYIPSTA